MTNLLLSLLVPSVTADSNEKPSGPLANQPLASMNALPVSFKEVLAMVDRYGPEAKSIAQIKQELQSLSLDTKSQEKFLSDLQSGKGSEDAFAGLGVPGLIPAVTSPNYHAVAAVVDFVPEVAAAPDIPVTDLPIDAVLPTVEATSPVVQDELTSEGLPVLGLADETTGRMASEQVGMAQDSDLLIQKTLPPQVGIPLTVPSSDVVPLEEAQASMIQPAPAAIPMPLATAEEVAATPSALSADPVLAETISALFSPANDTGRPAPVVDKNNADAAAAKGTPPTLEDVSFRLPEEAPHILRPNMSDAQDASAESAPIPIPAVADRTPAVHASFDRQDTSIPVTPDLSALHPSAGNAAHRTGFDPLLASDPRMIQLQVQVRPGQPLGDQLRVHIRQAVSDGNDQISIRLMPEHLGRIEVAIDMGADGNAQVRVLADKAETFDLLQRDARGLERALADAGIKADSGSLQFQLRGEGQGQQAGAQSGFGDGRGYGQGRPGAEPSAGNGSGQDILPIEDNGLYRLVATTGVNIRV